MVKVCEEWFPMGSYPGQRTPGFYMEPTLKNNLDLWLKNVNHDWDFVIIITGQGMVRVGKSVLAQQIACYWHYSIWKKTGTEVPFSIEENIVFHGGELIKKGNKLGAKYKYGSLIFDEAGADLEGAKVMKRNTQAVKDYLRECGQYNMLTLLVLPEFFDLPKGIAMSRADALIDCHTTVGDDDLWERGHFRFFGRPSKKKLYLYGKKDLNYHAAKPDFRGDWDNLYVIDEEEYKSQKVKALKTREEMTAKESRQAMYMKGMVKVLQVDFDLSSREIARRIKAKQRFSASHMYINRLMDGEEEDLDEEVLT